LTRAGWLLGAHTDAARPMLEANVRYWRERGEDVELVEGQRLRDLTGSTLYSSAKLNRRAFGINPLAYVRGLAGAAVGIGAAIHTQSRGGNLIYRHVPMCLFEHEPELRGPPPAPTKSGTTNCAKFSANRR